MMNNAEDFFTSAYADYFVGFIGCSPALAAPCYAVNERCVSRLVYLDCDKVLRVKEILCPVESFPNIWLEYGIEEQGKARWGTHDVGLLTASANVDYIAYGYGNHSRCYLFPFQQIQATWLNNRAAWRKRYEKIVAEACGVKHLALSVPIEQVIKAMSAGYCVTVPQLELTSAQEAA